MRTAVLLLTIAVLAPASFQKAPPPAAPAKKNPLLKLIEPWPTPEKMKEHRETSESLALFSQADVLPITLVGDFKTINKDRRPESTARYPGIISVTDERGREQTIKVKLSPRGHFRRMARNCAFVPLRVELSEAEVAGTVDAVGTGAADFQLGQPVVSLTHGGGMAEFVAGPEGRAATTGCLGHESMQRRVVSSAVAGAVAGSRRWGSSLRPPLHHGRRHRSRRPEARTR